MNFGSNSITGRKHNRRRAFARAWFAACGCIVLTACSGPADSAAPAPANGAIAPRNESTVHVRIVDAEGAPLAGMVPIASEGPSMLSEFVAQGAPSGSDGASVVNYPKEKWVYLRAADPNGAMMASGHIEIEPGEAVDPNEPMVLKMVAAASVSAELHGGDGTPVGPGPVGLVLLHPAHGQWWRAEGESDAAGRVTFTGLPAGVYALKVELGEAGEATIREAVLVGGEMKDIGVVTAHAGV